MIADRFTNGFDPEIVKAWIADDPDPVTAAALQKQLDAATGEPGEAADRAIADITEGFQGLLQFGTAGLRGEIGPGPSRMNAAVVTRAAAGLAAALRDVVGEGFTVAIGCDARHGSADFARVTAAVVTQAGGHAMLLPAQLPTPLLAFAVKHLGTDAGVMVTASHNPPQDNGYKVYLGERPLVGSARAAAAADGRELTDAELETIAAGAGAQIVEPFDAFIAGKIAEVPSVGSMTLPDTGWTELGDEVLDAYTERLAEFSDMAGARQSAPLTIVYTAMHGVGGQTALRVLSQAGFTDVHVVDQQHQPDPDFPTVTFPNPEEPGALELAFAKAREVGADLIIANDPDADRVSAAVPDPRDESGYRQLSGDEVGLLLAEFMAGTVRARQAVGETCVMANSIVSSTAVAHLAANRGIAHRQTLTGFKWITRVPGLVYGYEEALGYCVDPEAVRDKDGISAAVVFAGLVSKLKSVGLSVEDQLDDIRQRDGVFLTAPLTFRFDDVEKITAAVDSLRSTPPAELARRDVVEVIDLAAGSDELPPTNGIKLRLAGGDRIIIRPSGTEPKLKCYLETVAPADGFDAPEDVRTAVAECRQRLSALSAALGTYLGL